MRRRYETIYGYQIDISIFSIDVALLVFSNLMLMLTPRCVMLRPGTVIFGDVTGYPDVINR